MDTWSVVAGIVFFIGIAAGGFIVARSPSFWIGFIVELFKRALPFILKRMPKEEEAEWRDAVLTNQEKEFWIKRALRKKGIK